MALPALVMACGALVIFASFLYPYFANYLGHDQSSYLFEAQRFLSGAEIYGPRLMESNPPLIIWFSALPVMLARWTHGSAVFSFRLLVIAMIFGSVAWCVALLRRSAAIVSPAAVALLGCAILWIEFSIGPYDFGQRENLLFILLVPYVLAASTSVVSRLSLAERCALGVAAGIAIWFKPQDILILVGLELFLAFRARTLRRALAPDFLALVLTSSFILALVLLLTPLYITEIVPLLSDVYWAFGTESTLVLALSLDFYILPLIAMFLVWLRLRRRLRDPETPLALLICGFASFVACDIQHTVWTYHRYPHRAFLLLALSYLLAERLDPVIGRLTSNSILVRRMVLAASGASAIMLLALAIQPRLAHFGKACTEKEDVDRIFAQYKPSTTVFVFSTSVYPLASAYNHGLNWGGRFAHLWMMPAIIQNELGRTSPTFPFKQLSPETVARLAALQRSETTEDLIYWRPSVVLVLHCSLDQPCQGIEGKSFDMISWFRQSPAFASTWSHYQQQPSTGIFDVYKLDP